MRRQRSMSGPDGSHQQCHCVCQPYFRDNECIKTPNCPYHTKLYQTIQNNMNLCPDAKPYSPDNESIKHGSGYNSFQGRFLGNRLSRLKVIIRIRNITSKDLQNMSLMTSLQESWSRLCRRIGQTLRHAAGSFAAIRRCCGAV